MGNNKPGFEGKVTYDDFFKTVSFYCGTSKYSSYQIKFVFQQHAVFPTEDKSDTSTGHIPVTVFKDKFYPGKVWRPEYMTQIERHKQEDLDKEKGPMSHKSESLRFSAIMDGKNQDDINAAHAHADKLKVLADAKRNKDDMSIQE